MWDKWTHLYEKNLESYDLWEKCASMRAVNIPPDVEALFAGKEEEMFARLTEEARRAIEEDGAGVILLGSTTMHQAGDYWPSTCLRPSSTPGPSRSRSPSRSCSSVSRTRRSTTRRRARSSTIGSSRWPAPERRWARTVRISTTSSRTRCQSTSRACHSVKIGDRSRWTSSEPQPGHGGEGFVGCGEVLLGALLALPQRYS